MRTGGVIVLALIGGLLAGLLLSEIIGIIGMLVFGIAAGIKFLPVYLAIAGAVAAPCFTGGPGAAPARDDAAERHGRGGGKHRPRCSSAPPPCRAR